MNPENESIENEEEKSLSSSINNSIENENDEKELNKNVLKKKIIYLFYKKLKNQMKKKINFYQKLKN